MFKILGYVRSYMRYACMNVLLNLASIIFSVFSLTMIIPFLGLLFGTQELVTTAPPLAMDTSSLVDNFYYHLSKIIAPDGVIHPEGQLHGLMFICLLVITLFFFKNMSYSKIRAVNPSMLIIF